MKAHQKHSKLLRPTFGNFGRNEIAIVGAKCNIIQQMAQQIISELSNNYNVAYIDADHKAPEKNSHKPNFELTDKIDFFQLQWQADLNKYKSNILFNETDLVLVNGNHFEATQQIVYIDSNRLPSIEKRVDQFTNVLAFVLKDDSTKIPEIIKNQIENWETVPQIIATDYTLIVNLIKDELLKSTVNIYGLVLTGGKSSRMGKDKRSLNYHGKAQQTQLADLLGEFCSEVYVSINTLQTNDIDNYATIRDSFVGMGPMGAILSAQQQNPNVAWLVLACDYPLMDKQTIAHLIKNRKTKAVATAYKSLEAHQFPEPLVAIYEPKSYITLLQFLGLGYSCPRKMLINSNVHLLESLNEKAFQNANEPAQMEAAKKLIEQK